MDRCGVRNSISRFPRRKGPFIRAWSRRRAMKRREITLVGVWLLVMSSPARFSHNQDRYRVHGLSLIDDLSAVIAASNPSERRTKCFGIDRGRKRCEVVGFCNSAGATQKRRYEACIEIRQARPKSAREILRQRVIRMLLIFGGTAYLVHVTNRVPRRPFGRQARHDLMLSLGDIEPVERVEQHEAIALGQKERFPFLPCRLRRDRRY